MRVDRDLMIHVIKNNCEATEKELADLLWDAAKSKDDLRGVFDYWFGNIVRTVEVIKTRHTITVVPRIIRQRRVVTEKARKHARKLVDRAKDEFRTAIVLMNVKLPDGTMLRDATFGQLRKLTGFLGDVSKLGKANEIVRNKLTESNLQDVYARHHRRNAA
jgi:hypothetical protein